jgi:hypothetical protein
MYLTDNPSGFPAKHRIAPNSFIAAQGFAVYFADEDTAAGPDHLNFRLSADRESIGLLDRHLNRVDTVIFAPQRSDVSQGRTTEGSLLYQSFSPPTFGLPNSTSPSLPDPVPLLDHLRITELMYNPAGDGDLEFIELHNTGTTTLNLEGVRLRNGVDFTFPAMTLAPGAYTVVVANQAKFVARYGASISVAGQYGASLNNAGENVELALPLPYEGEIHDFTYDDVWYPKTDGGGKSLVIGNPLFDRDSWDLPTGWRASYATGGSPGRADLLYADQNGDGSVGLADLILLRNKIGTANLTGDINNDGVVNVADVVSFVSSYRVSTTAAPSPAASSLVVARSARDQAIVDESQAATEATSLRTRRSTTVAISTRRESNDRLRSRTDASTALSATDQVFAEESTASTSRSRTLRRLRR